MWELSSFGGNLYCSNVYRTLGMSCAPMAAQKRASLYACRPSYNDGRNMDDRHQPATKAQELRAFLFLTVVTAPILAVAVVGGYGFFIWMYQLFTGSLPSG